MDNCNLLMVSRLIVSEIGVLCSSYDIALANACWWTILEHSSYLAYKYNNQAQTSGMLARLNINITFASGSRGFRFLTASKSFSANLNFPSAMFADALL